MTSTQKTADDVLDLDPGAPGQRGDLGVAAAHYLDIAYRNARRRIDTGEHPDDVMVTVSNVVLDWLIARDHPEYETLGKTAKFVYYVEREVRERIGAASTAAWFTCPNPVLRGRTPVESIIAHQFREVGTALLRLEPWHRP